MNEEDIKTVALAMIDLIGDFKNSKGWLDAISNVLPKHLSTSKRFIKLIKQHCLKMKTKRVKEGDVTKKYQELTDVLFGLDDYIEKFKAKKVNTGFSYNSGENTEWETVESLRSLIKEHVDPTFEI